MMKRRGNVDYITNVYVTYYHRQTDEDYYMYWMDTEFKDPPIEFFNQSNYWMDSSNNNTSFTFAKSYIPASSILDKANVDDVGRPIIKFKYSVYYYNVVMFQRIKDNYYDISDYNSALSVWNQHNGPAAQQLKVSQINVPNNTAFPDGYQTDHAFCRWQGEFYISVAGAYNMVCSADDRAYIKIDDTSDPGSNLTLSAGWHKFDLITLDTGGQWNVVVTLTNPNGDTANIETYKLRVSTDLFE